MVGRDGVEDAPDERAVVVGGRADPAPTTGHRSRARRTISARTAAYSRSAAAMIRSGVRSSDRIVWRIFRAKSSGPRRASPSLAGRTTSRRWASNAAIGGPGRLGGGLQARRDGGDGRVLGVGLGLAERVVDQRPDARQLLERGLGLEPPDGPAIDPDERRRRAVEDAAAGPRAGPPPTQPVAERRELAGEQQSNRPSPRR